MDKPINNDTPIMGNCLSCQGLVRVPATAPTSSTVKCPHCGKSFSLSQILNHAVPELEIVTDDQEVDSLDDQGAAKDAKGRFVVAKQLRQNSKKRRRKRRRSRSRRDREADGMVPLPKPIGEVAESSTAIVDEVDDSRFADNDSDSGAHSARESFDSRRSSGRSSSGRSSSGRSSSGRSSSGRRSSSRSSGGRSSSSRSSRSGSSSRNTPKKSSGAESVVEIFKVALGGAMAIPFAYILVLWGLRQDPLAVAPMLVERAPFLVPAEFRPEEEEPDANVADDDDGQVDLTDGLNEEDVPDVSGGLTKPLRERS